MSIALINEKYHDYIEFYNRIYDLKTGESQQLAEDLIKFCTERKWDSSAVLMIISNAAECNLLYLREYWELFKTIFNHFQIRPPTHFLRSHIAVLYCKEYHRIPNFRIPDHLSNYQEMSIDEILNVYESSSLMHCILHDNINDFAITLGPILDEETVNQEYEQRTLLEWCSYHGALMCFRYLRGHNAELTDDCLAYSFIGKNKEIIMECIVEYGEMLKEINLNDICILINDEEFITALHDDYNQRWTLSDASNSLNLKAFLILASLTNQQQSVYDKLSLFGITEFITNRPSDNSTSLHHAARYNNICYITKLVELGADIQFREDGGSTPLIIAADHNNVESVVKLIEFGASIEAADDNGETALIAAAKSNSIDAITKLIELRANIEARKNTGETALIVAARNNQDDAISKLIELGANIEAKNNTGETALIVAGRYDKIYSIFQLVELGANIEAADDDGNTALIYAAEYEHIDSVSNLVDLGANIEAKNNDGLTPLIVAAGYNKIDSISKLYELGANIEARTNNGLTALIIAAANNSVNSISKLVELGANIEAKENTGATALFAAASKNSVDSILKLVELGAFIEAKDNKGLTPLNKAIEMNHPDAIITLINSGARLNTKDEIGKRSLAKLKETDIYHFLELTGLKAENDY